jgi:thioredoxin-like negative regulator of GroEL
LQPAPVAADAEPEGIPWDRDFKAAMRRARESGKPVMVDFWAEWCDWCHKLDATTYRDPTVVDLARDFVAVKVNTEGSLAEVERAAQYGVETLPTIGFLSPGGRLFLRREGFEGPDRFPATLQEARGLAKDVIALEGSLTRNERDAAALAGLGALLVEQKLFAESRELLRRACKVDKARPAKERKHSRRVLALVEREGGKKADSERLLEEALALQPADPDEDAAVLFALGEIYLGRGQAEKARAAWQRSLQMAPQGAAARLASEALAGLPAR